MPAITVTINGRNYDIACDDGQEAHLTRLSKYIDTRVEELVAAVGQVGDARLLVMVCLLIADELSDAYAEMEKLKGKNESAAQRLAAEEALSDSIDAIADRIESIAERLERS